MNGKDSSKRNAEARKQAHQTANDLFMSALSESESRHKEAMRKAAEFKRKVAGSPSVKTGRMKSFGVYVIELDENPYAVYVGYTSKKFSDRLEEHMNGPNNQGKVFKRGAKGILRPDLYNNIKVFSDEEAAKKKECELARKLNSEGYTVYGHRGCCGIKNSYPPTK